MFRFDSCCFGNLSHLSGIIKLLIFRREVLMRFADIFNVYVNMYLHTRNLFIVYIRETLRLLGIGDLVHFLSKHISVTCLTINVRWSNIVCRFNVFTPSSLRYVRTALVSAYALGVYELFLIFNFISSLQFSYHVVSTLFFCIINRVPYLLLSIENISTFHTSKNLHMIVTYYQCSIFFLITSF